jgi:hypothetical protein
MICPLHLDNPQVTADQGSQTSREFAGGAEADPRCSHQGYQIQLVGDYHLFSLALIQVT